MTTKAHAIVVGLIAAGFAGPVACGGQPAGRSPQAAGEGPKVLTDLRARGWALLPAPRTVTLLKGQVRLDANWRLGRAGVKADDIAVRTLRGELAREHGLKLAEGAGDGGVVRLRLTDGAVKTGAADAVRRQAYRITIAPKQVEVVANAPPGMFYGVQTLLQLLAGSGGEALLLPEGTITDWPRYPLRFVHWDTKHHQDRLATLKRFCDWMGRFKLNMVSFELEDKFAYPSHPVIAAPTAFTTAQMRELTRYALARHIQIVPNVQAPAHMTYVLKHKAFAHLRCDGSNYQICMDDPKARKLIFDMYDDLCRATPGVKYFHVSTDEVYYAGICEKYRKPYNPTNRSLTWVDFVRAAHGHLAKRGRRIIIWAEFPLLAEHVRLLPRDIINGICTLNVAPAFRKAMADRGMQQLAYASMQGAEKLFPNHFAYAGPRGRAARGRLATAFETTTRMAGRKDVIGTFAAAWDDAGLHNETFWLGWATMAQGAWTPGAASVDQTVADFMDVFYGRGVSDMAAVYRDMQEQARFWEYAWSRLPSKVRRPGYGYSQAKRPVGRTDLSLSPPALPKLPDLTMQDGFRTRYAKLLAEVPAKLRANRRLAARLHANISKARRNRHNLEVFCSLVYFERGFLNLLDAVAAAEELLTQAQRVAKAGKPDRAVAMLARAHGRVSAAMRGQRRTYRDMVAVWEKGRYRRNAPAGGKKFLHVMDDVKDHFADRRADLSYHMAPIESIGLDAWCAGLAKVIRGYARGRGIKAPPLAGETADD